MAIWYSSDLGWTSGQDVSANFSTLVEKSFKPGDTLVLEGMFRVSGKDLQLPDDFTLSAEYGGGFEITDAKTNKDHFLLLGDRNTIDNVTFEVPNTPSTEFDYMSAKKGIDYTNKDLILLNNADDVTILNSTFSGNITKHLDVHDSSNLTVEGVHFIGGFRQMRIAGQSDDVTIIRSHFEDSSGDGIKTAPKDGFGPQRMEVRDSFFEGAARDGIDTTGGFKDAVVSNTVFYDNGMAAFDIKNALNDRSDDSSFRENSNILIENSRIIDTRNGLVMTTNDNVGIVNSSNVKDLVPHDILVVDTVFERTDNWDQDFRAFHIKDGHSINWENLTFLGEIIESRVYDDRYVLGDIGGTVTTYGESTNSNDYWDYDVGPVRSGPSSEAAPAAPEPAPEPEAQPEPENTPDDEPVVIDEPASTEEDASLVEEPAPAPVPTPPVVAPIPVANDDPVYQDAADEEPAERIESEYLKIYAVFTDTGERVLLSGTDGFIALGAVGGRELTLVAESVDSGAAIGSVRMSLSDVQSQLENVEPYALFGDSKGELKDGLVIDDGVHAVELTVYSGRGGKGDVLENIQFDLSLGTAAPNETSTAEPAFSVAETIVDEDTVVEATEPKAEPVVDLASLEEVELLFADDADETVAQPDPAPGDATQQTSQSELLNIYAMFTDTGESILLNGTGAEINLADLAGRDMTLVAESKDASASIGSVELSLGSEFSRVENVAPYALFGDKKGSLYDGAEISPGDYDLAITVYSMKGGKGEILEQNEFSLSVTSEPKIDDLTGLTYVDTAPDAWMMVEDADQTGWDELLF
ncbi:MAG: right-handed parallel beta-helix repeat-containing protein [Pseudomonadota bacterium]